MGKYLAPEKYAEIMAGKPAELDSSAVDSELRARGYDVPAPMGVETSRGAESVAPTMRDTGAPFDLRRISLNALPSVGGAVGGIAGGVSGGPGGAIGGAALGGAGGEAVKQHAMRLLKMPGLPSGPLDAAARMALSAGTEALGEGGGLALSAGLKRIPRAAMGGALAIPRKASQQWRTMRQRARPEIAPEVPADMVDAALQERLAIGGSPQFPGTKKVEALRGESASEADAMLRTIKRGRSKASPPLNASVLLDDVWKLKASLKSSPRAAEDMAMVDDLAEKFLASHRKTTKGGTTFEKLTPDEVNEIKTSAQRRIKDVYDKKGQALDEKNAINKRFLEALASGARKKLESEYDRIAVMLGRPTGDLAAANARTGRMAQLGEHVFAREAQPISYGSPIERLMLVPSVIRALGRPGVTSRLANAANAPLIQGPGREAARQLPRLLTMGARNVLDDEYDENSP